MKFFGKVGFMETVETAPSVYESTYVEKEYYGDHVSPYSSKWKAASKLNNDDAVTTKISILADPYASNNFRKIRYVEWLGELWQVTNVEVQFPRLILSVGDVYNK